MAGGNEATGHWTTFEYDLGTGQNLWGRLARIVYGNGYVERFSYTSSGLVAQKTQAPSAMLSPSPSVDYTWDNEGQVTSVTYPETGVPRQGGGYDAVARRVVSYGRDAAGRLQNVVSGGVTMAGNAQYNAAGQLLSYVAPGGTLSFSYNSRGQMTADSYKAYNYSATANDGRLVSQRDVVSGEEVSYQYDELGRLTAAATAGPAWGLAWTFDGFGNRLSQTVTKGTGPAVNLTVDAATNRIAMTGFVYDANGNQTQWMVGQETRSATFDIENRVTQVATASATEVYFYNAANQRVVKDNPYSSQTRDFVYGLGGELLGEYERCGTGGGWYVPCNKQERSYLGGRLIEVEGVRKVVDRMGMSTSLGYPYLENTGGPEATWKRDAGTGLDYAWNRYYSATWGRFTSPDPFQHGASPANPQSWNAYAYVNGDPANKVDRTGLFSDDPCAGDLGCQYQIADGFLAGGVDQLGGVGGLNLCPGGEGFLPNPACVWPVLALQKAPPPPDMHAICQEIEAGFLSAYLAKRGSPLAAYALRIVQASEAAGLDDRFIVALAGNETTYGKYMNWGAFNAFNNGQGRNFKDFGEAIDGVINLIGHNALYRGYKSTRDIYAVYEQGDITKTSATQGNLDRIYGAQLGGNLGNVRFTRCGSQ